MLESSGRGYCPINPLPNLSSSEMVVAPSEPSPSIAKVNKTRGTNKVLELPGVNVVNKLPTFHLLMWSNYAIEISHNKRRKFLHKQPEDLRSEHPPLLVLNTSINARDEPRAINLLGDD